MQFYGVGEDPVGVGSIRGDSVMADNVLEPLAVNAGGQDLERVQDDIGVSERPVNFVARREDPATIGAGEHLAQDGDRTCDFAHEVKGRNIALEREPLGFKVYGSFSC